MEVESWPSLQPEPFPRQPGKVSNPPPEEERPSPERPLGLDKDSEIKNGLKIKNYPEKE